MLVTNEVGELKKVGLFGPPGIESYLTQFFEPEISLFFESFDVIKGQSEFKGLAKLLSSLGMEVIDLKGAYASILPPPTLNAEKLLSGFLKKVPQSDKSVLENLLHLDAQAYGEEKAVALNKSLSLSHKLPLGNIFFARDQANVVFDTCVLGNMKFDIRKPEVAVIYNALKSLGYSKFLQVSDGAFEGGDAMVIGNDVYIGNGMRTEFQGAQQVAGYFKQQGKKVYLVKIPRTGSFNGDMEIMHLDTFFMPLTDDKAIGCLQVLEECKVADLETGGELPFLSHLVDAGYAVLAIPKKEQKNYAANMLVTKPGVVIMPSDYNPITADTLTKNGVMVYSAALLHLTKAVGATHCMALQIEKY